jgi:hypothetical protein
VLEATTPKVRISSSTPLSLDPQSDEIPAAAPRRGRGERWRQEGEGGAAGESERETGSTTPAY